MNFRRFNPFASASSRPTPTKKKPPKPPKTSAGDTVSSYEPEQDPPSRLRNYDLFCLTKLLSVSTTAPESARDAVSGNGKESESTSRDRVDGDPDSNEKESKSSEPPESLKSSKSGRKSRSSKRPQVTINVVASGGRYGGREFIALSCSNKHLIIRSIGSVGNLSDTNESLPLVRMIPWFDYPVKRITAMDFSPSGSWLLCVTLDAAIYLIPIRSLLKFNPGTATQGVLKPSTETLTSAGGVRAGGGHRRMHSVDLPSLAHRVLSHSPYSGVVEDMFMFGDDDSHFPTEEAFGPFDDITEIEPRNRTDSAAISHCLWWQTFDGDDYAFVTSLAGTIDFVNLRTHKRTICRLGVTIYKIEMIVQGDQSKTLLIHTLDEGYFLLLLEQKIIPPSPDDSESQDVLIPKTLSRLMSAPATLLGSVGSSEETPREPYYQTYPRDGQKNKDDFSQRRINFFPKGCRLSVQHRKSGPVIGVYNPQLHTFALYDVDHLHKPPMFEYKIAPAQVHHFTERFIFSFSVGGRHQNHISVISNILATARPGEMNPSHESVMQTLMLPPDEKILGIFRVSQAEDDEPETENSRSSPGFMLWTSRAVYWCHRSRPAASLFFELVEQGRETTDAEHLGKTLSLNLHALYERAGDKAFSDGEHTRALNLYRLSNARISKLVKQFLVDNKQTTVGEVRDLEAVMGLLKGALSSGLYNTASSQVITSTAQGGRRRPRIGGLVTARGMVSDLLFLCYLQCLLRDNGTLSNCAEISRQFKTFVETNIDFEAEQAIMKLLEIGDISMVLRIAHKRHRMRWCLDLIAEHGAYHLTRVHIDWLLTRGYASLLIGSPATLIPDPAGGQYLAYLLSSETDTNSPDASLGWMLVENRVGSPKSPDSTAVTDPSDSLGTVIFRSLTPSQQLKVIMFEMTELHSLSIKNPRDSSNSLLEQSPSLSSLQPNRYMILSSIILPGLDIIGLVRFTKFIDTIVDPPNPRKSKSTAFSSSASSLPSKRFNSRHGTSSSSSMSERERRRRRKRERENFAQNLVILPTALVTVFLQAIIRIRYLWKDKANRPTKDPTPSRPPSPVSTPSQSRSFRRSINAVIRMRHKAVENLSGGPVTVADMQYYATRRLGQALKVYAGLYPVQTIVTYCVDSGDWEAAGRVYECENSWSDAIQCVLKEQYLKLEDLREQNIDLSPLPKLEQFGDVKDESGDDLSDLPPLEIGTPSRSPSHGGSINLKIKSHEEEKCVHTIEELLSTHICKINNDIDQAVHLLMIFNFWDHYCWDISSLEDAMYDSFKLIADALSVIIFTPEVLQPLTRTAYRVSETDSKKDDEKESDLEETSEQQQSPFDMFKMDSKIRFSSRLYLEVTKYRLQKLNPGNGANGNF